MLLNRLALQTAHQFAAKASYQSAGQKLMNATVQLRSGGSEYFVGSGVILGAGKEVAFKDGKWATTGTQFTVLVSALHNLYINANKTTKIPPLAGNTVTWDQTVASTFAKDVKIYYGPAPLVWGGKPTGEAVISRVVPVFTRNHRAAGKMIDIPKDSSADGQAFQLVNMKGATRADGVASGGPDDGVTPAGGTEAQSWSYDVVLLISKDAKLYTYATSGSCGYMGAKKLEDLGNELLPGWSEGAAKYKVPVLGRDWRILQLGYGMTSDPDVRVQTGVEKTKRPESDPPAPKTAPPVPAPIYERLQYKRALPKAASDTAFYQNTEFKLPNGTDLVLAHQGGILLDCKGGNNSTFSGDSGGPVAAFPAAGGAEAYLIGVNTGAGAATSDEAARKPPGTSGSVWEYDNNVVTSLGFFYQNLFDLRFQNV